MRRRYEHHGRPNAFVEITHQDSAVRLGFGGLGRAPSGGRSERHRDAAAAELSVQHQHRRLLAKGYWPGRHDPDLIAAIRRAPDDRGGYEVYADWLEEHDDPRAAFIRTGVERPEDRWLLRPPVTGLRLELNWRHGFVHTAIVAWDYSTMRAELLRGTLGRLIDHPSGHFVQRVAFERFYSWSFMVRGFEHPIWPETLRDIVSRAPCLRELVVPDVVGDALRQPGFLPPTVQLVLTTPPP